MKHLHKIFLPLLLIVSLILPLQVNLIVFATENESVIIHNIDVGQGDATLIKSSGHYMLIDAGDTDKGAEITSYIKKQGISKLDYVIATHPHADHIGGMTDVINTFDINTFILPNVVHTSKTFENMLDALIDKNIKTITPKVGNTYDLGSSSFTILAPNSSKYKDLNDYSVVIKLTCGKNSFIFTGDAETLSENEILKNDIDIDADYIKIGHHGSNSSTSSAFLKAINPKYAVISVGADNSYGHPTENTLNRLKNNNIETYRTDLNGTIIVSSDGKTIKITTSKTVSQKPVKKTNTTQQKPVTKPTSQPISNNTTHYIGNSNTFVYHLPTCRYVKRMNGANKVQLTQNDLRFYKPCKKCNP